MQEKSVDLVDQIYAKVMASVNEKGADYSSFTEENSIAIFRGTFLSNFYAVPVVLDGKNYPTVEHAYQAAKLSLLDWNILDQETKDEISEALKLKGYAASVVIGKELFTDEKMTAGNIKVISEILQKHGYVDEEWKDRRIKIMINLLIQKFSTEEMKTRLQETGEKMLIEGNEWNDTLWGVCDGKGRNTLGIILMEIRKLGKN